MNMNTDKDVLRRQERILCTAGNLYTQRRSSVSNTLVFQSVRLEQETHVKYETYSCSNTDAYVSF